MGASAVDKGNRMTLDELLNKFEGVLLAAPILRADIIDMVQDERADEREQCARIADDHDVLEEMGAATAWQIGNEIRNRNTEES